jgi:Flp pilus assembly protein CpaB
LVALTELVEAGKVTPIIGGTYPLGQTAEGIRHVAAGHARGTLVIAVRPSTEENHMPTNQARHAEAEGDAALVTVAA